jgi:hypothetical protein
MAVSAIINMGSLGYRGASAPDFGCFVVLVACGGLILGKNLVEVLRIILGSYQLQSLLPPLFFDDDFLEKNSRTNIQHTHSTDDVSCFISFASSYKIFHIPWPLHSILKNIFPAIMLLEVKNNVA